MQYVIWRGKKEEYGLFDQGTGDAPTVPTLTYEQFRALEDFLKKKDNPALLPIQIAYYTGLRIGEVCALTWQDVDLDEQYLTVRRSIRYNGARHKTEIGATKRKKVRTVDFCDTLAAILKAAKSEQIGNRLRYGELYSLNYYTEVRGGKTGPMQGSTPCPGRWRCRRGIGNCPLSVSGLTEPLKTPGTVGIMCRQAKKKVRGWRTFTSIRLDTRSPAICSPTARHPGRAGAAGPCRCQYHDEYLRPRHKGGQAYLRTAAG